MSDDPVQWLLALRAPGWLLVLVAIFLGGAVVIGAWLLWRRAVVGALALLRRALRHPAPSDVLPHPVLAALVEHNATASAGSETNARAVATLVYTPAA